MVKKLAVILAAVMLFTCVFAACGEKNPFLGKWTGIDEGLEASYVFEADGKGYSQAIGLSVDFTYEIDGNKVTLTIDSTKLMEDMLGMTVEEMIAEGMLESADELINVQTGELNGDVLTIDGTEYTKAD